ncbi:glycosyltransferase family 4 protein [Pseudomonas sp. LSJ-87]|uniref:glycosyltransferase family 4 protein n=1 Tax=Pseudomonas sp. LSJ-87 TaxID=3079932 RepID=UPI002941B664|nr:glycosyltransferase family 4 protein [Pseudomonas sp. LSJ-87]MDV5099301.1 glycosyltransferase family 4 protein [Pseudomonas sp. LSJ-87]
MKKLWILNHYAQEPGGAGGTRHFSLARYLKSYGWNSTIIAASVDHQSGKQRLADNEQSRLDVCQDVPFLWLKTSAYSGNGGGRMINMLQYAWQLVKPGTLSKLDKPDLIFASSVHLFTGLAGVFLAWRLKVPCVFEVRDLWPQTLVDMGRIRDSDFITRVLRVIEKFIYKRSKRIVVLLPEAWRYIVPLGIPKEQIVWLPNGVDLEGFAFYPLSHEKPRQRFELMYFGAHGQANGLESVLEAMHVLKLRGLGQNVVLRMIGDGPLKNQLQAQAAAMQLDNVLFEASVKKSEIPNLAREADAFIISVLDLPNLYRFGISMNKIFDYMAAGRPTIIASSAINNPIAEADGGITVSPDNPEEMADAIVKLADLNRDELSLMGVAARRYVESNHEYQKLALKLAGVLNDVANEA